MPTSHLLLSGFGEEVTEEDIQEKMRDFCKYRRIYFFYDANQFSRGYCLIDLDSVEASVHIIEYTQKVPLQIKNYSLTVCYASEATVRFPLSLSTI